MEKWINNPKKFSNKFTESNKPTNFKNELENLKKDLEDSIIRLERNAEFPPYLSDALERFNEVVNRVNYTVNNYLEG